MRPEEQQCLNNIRAVLAHYGIRGYEPMEVAPDRAYFYDGPWSVFPAESFHKWNRFAGGHGATAVRGVREFVPMYSMQVIWHSIGIVECDFDIFNPDYGVGLVVCHGFECLWHKLNRYRTDPFRIRAGLIGRGIGVDNARWVQNPAPVQGSTGEIGVKGKVGNQGSTDSYGERGSQ